jgi:ATP-binding cassette subfamily B protein
VTFRPEVRQGITFENVRFSYTGAEPTLRDINLQIPAGSHVAFVGPTGAGKSTLVNLIPRFYDVDQGVVRIDGQDIRSFSLPGLRQAISIVSQDTFIFAATILENIRLGRLEATDDEVIEAARQARLHDFIMTLPAGYDTLVGERGGRLSGGQKQRISIARALLRNSPILILDEATSSLDAETESQILAELDEVTRGKTVISITHRLGLAIKSDRIYVLQAGRVVQMGSHEELIRQDGLYRKLFEDQNRELMKRSAGEQLDATLSRLESVPAFSMVPIDELTCAASLRDSRRYVAGDLVSANGGNGSLYLLRAGQLELTVPDPTGGAQRLAITAPTRTDGSGRLSLLLSVPHEVSARALTETEIAVLDPAELRNLLGGAWQESAAGLNGGPAGEPKSGAGAPALT